MIIVGAGATGLMAARELSKASKKVLVLEARDRIGGRIYPLDQKKWGFPAQGGAEFVHGAAPITKSIAKEAGMTLTSLEGDMWNIKDGQLTVNDQFVPNQELLVPRLKELKEDISISEFLNKNFSESKYEELRNSIVRMVEGYDVGDPNKISTFALRDEWLGTDEWTQYRIQEGYGVMLEYLSKDLKIELNREVSEVDFDADKVLVSCNDGCSYKSNKVLVTVPLPLINKIKFNPQIKNKIKAASEIGYGGAIKILLKFKSRWWVSALGNDFNEMDFMISNERFSVWWTQFPEDIAVLCGWLGGPKTENYLDIPNEAILEESLSSLSRIFKVPLKQIKSRLVLGEVFNWPTDKFSLGAYSYTTPLTEEAQEELLKPESGKLFFAGEALYQGHDAATVEGALASGLEAAKRIGV